MTSLSRVDKLTLSAYADPGLATTGGNGQYSRWTNRFQPSLLNVKGIQLLNANMINSVLQLNDNSQLMFFYYVNSITTPNLRCVRLLPSNYVPYPGFTAFTRNRYFNSVVELVAALNAASATGGDDITYNPLWLANMITFSYDTNSRRITIVSTGGAVPVTPAAADDPNVLATLGGAATPKMYCYDTPAATYPAARVQPFVRGVSMNARLGFAMSYNSRGLYWTSSSVISAASSIGVLTTAPIEADANPILLGTQNVSIYLSVISGSGVDSSSLGKRNLLQSIPIEVAPLNINSYTASSVEKPALSVANEISEITVELLDDYGQPFLQPPNYNTDLTLSLYY